MKNFGARLTRPEVLVPIPAKVLRSHMQPTPQPFTSMLAACRQEDRRAQEQLYRILFPRLLPIGLRYLRNREEAVGVVNQAMLRVFQSLDDFRGEGSFEGWAKTITHRTVLNFLRSEGRARRRFQPDRFDPPASVANTAPDRLNAEDILKLLQALPDYLRVVFSLVVIDGLSHAEIARALEITETASRYRLLRARQLLRDYYATANRINEAHL